MNGNFTVISNEEYAEFLDMKNRLENIQEFIKAKEPYEKQSRRDLEVSLDIALLLTKTDPFKK